MELSVTNFGDYNVKNVKSFMGREGYGFNANLYRGTKKIAFCIDSGNGGDVNIHWLDIAERALLEKHILTLSPVNSESGELKIDMGWFITDCVSKMETERDIKKMKKQCQTKTLFRTSSHKYGQYVIINAVFSEKVKAQLLQKYGASTEIFNEVLEQNKIPSVLA